MCFHFLYTENNNWVQILKSNFFFFLLVMGPTENENQKYNFFQLTK